MSNSFQANDPSLESQWRSVILFGKNSATYKFAFAKSLLELVDKETTKISLADLSVPFARSITAHLQISDKQGTSGSSEFLNECRKFNQGKLSESRLFEITEKLGFVNVVDAFQNVSGGELAKPFYEKNYTGGRKEIVITEHLLKLKETFQYGNFDQEVEARWSLVETAWNLNINPNLLEMQYDQDGSLFFIETAVMRRIDVSHVRDSLNGYQKGKCFYSFGDISVAKNHPKICEVDHFLPHSNKKIHLERGANINGVWNLVLADASVNSNKSNRVPDIKYLDRLYSRNEYYIESKHPLAETIINQTGRTTRDRRKFLQYHYDLARESGNGDWTPSEELPGTF